MRSLPAVLFLGGFLFAFSPVLAKDTAVTGAKDSASLTPDAADTAEPTVTPVPKRVLKKAPNLKQVIEIHKPMPDPSWGKVLQYHMETAPDAKGTLHKFLFQSEDGILRSAIYHDETSGDGYWEVLVWDLP